MIAVLQVVSAIAAGVAAYYWLKSARVPLPDNVNDYDGGSFGDDPTPVNDGPTRLRNAIAEQSRFSSYGAVAAAASAICQMLVMLIEAVT